MPIMPDEVFPGGYPTEYLLSRIRSRRSFLSETGPMEKGKLQSFVGNDQKIWQVAQSERRWLFGQMNHELRSMLVPVFVYFEINTLVHIIRSLVSAEPVNIPSLLQKSLLRKRIKDILSNRSSVLEVLARFERYCCEQRVDVAGLVTAYEQGGLRKSEEVLRSRLLLHALHASRHCIVNAFIKDLVDMRNLLVLSMWRRWQVKGAPLLVTGGGINMKFPGKDITENDLHRMIRRWCGGAELSVDQLHPVALEPILQSRLLGKLTRMRRLGDPVSECIEYIWRLFLVTRERSLHYHGGMTGERIGSAGKL